MSQVKHTAPCDYNKLRRPRYFHGMLLDEKDFEAEQAYHMAKRRIFNRMVHGWGVVCGLGLEGRTGGTTLTITPGLALDCVGNEIWVNESFSVDLSKLLADSIQSRSSDACAEDEKDHEGVIRDVCIYYTEAPSDPQPVYAPSADCKEQTCDYARIREGFCVRLQETSAPRDEPGLLARFCNCDNCKSTDPCAQGRAGCGEPSCEGLEGQELCRCQVLGKYCSEPLPCPSCEPAQCGQHCVVLGRVRFDAKGCLVDVCVNEGRRYVLTGPMVQHLFTTVYGGIGDWLVAPGGEKPLPTAAQIVGNPIHALCVFFRRFFLAGSSWRKLFPDWLPLTDKANDCIEGRAPAPRDSHKGVPTKAHHNRLVGVAGYESILEQPMSDAILLERDEEVAGLRTQLEALQGRLEALALAGHEVEVAAGEEAKSDVAKSEKATPKKAAKKSTKKGAAKKGAKKAPPKKKA